MPAKLTPAKIRKFEAHIRKAYLSVVFELTVTHNLLKGNIIELSTIVVENRKLGTGTAIMRELCGFADRNAAEIRLTPASKGDYAATTSRARLIRFYRRFGFVKDNETRRDFACVPRMIRKPLDLKAGGVPR
jgi:hypothetical protein